MKNITLLLLLLISASCYSQIKGTVTDVKGNPLAFVNIFEEKCGFSSKLESRK